MVGLTGTPASNGLMDLWAETFLIDKGVRLGRFIGRYREAYFRAAGMNPYTGIVYNYIPLPGAEEAIYSKISDISVSMKALDYLDMPEQVTVNHWVEMDAAERQVYDDMKADLLTHMPMRRSSPESSCRWQTALCMTIRATSPRSMTGNWRCWKT